MGLTLLRETELLKQLRMRDVHAFSELHTHYHEKIYHYALHIVKSPALAEDITQETFIKLWEQAEEIFTDRPLHSFLFTLTRNHALNLLRRAKKETWISEEIISNAILVAEDGIQYTERRQTTDFISMAIETLPPKRRMIYELCRNQGYSYKEAAEQLHISDSTVNSQMVKAIKSIKDYMLRNGALILLLFIRP